MSSAVPSTRLHGPRPPPGRVQPPSLNTSSSSPPATPPLSQPPPEQWQPLLIKKNPRPKLQLPPLSISQPSNKSNDPETYNYYGAPPPEQPPSRAADGGGGGLTLQIPTSAEASSDRTLRPNSIQPDAFVMDDLRSTIEALGAGSRVNTTSSDRRPNSREREFSTDTVVPSAGGGGETTTTGSHSREYDDEKWSDSVLTPLDRLGEGAGGVVWKVKDNRNGEIYARKTIPTHSTPAKQLMAELRHLSESKHANICEFYGAYMSGSSSELNVVMELCDGGSLEAIGKKIRETNGRTGEHVIGKLADGILKGLIHLHGLNIIHRDIKPSNILLTLGGVVKLCDFGVSGDLIDSMVMTFTGTSAYMAPERLTGQKYSVRADVWSTGLSLLELAQNEFPLPELDGIFALMDYISVTPIELHDDEEVKWSESMKDFIHQCLQAKPTERPHPRDLLKHPWVISCAADIEDKQMSKWVRRIWGIKKERADGEKKGHRTKRKESSRPASRHDAEGSGSGGISGGATNGTGAPNSHSSGDVPPWEES